MLQRLREEGAANGELGEELISPERATIDRFFRKLRPAEGTGVVDRALARRLSPAERIWAEYVLLSGFLNRADRRGLAALAEIGAGPTYAVLSDVLDELSGADREAARRVLRVLERRRPE